MGTEIEKRSSFMSSSASDVRSWVVAIEREEERHHHEQQKTKTSIYIVPKCIKDIHGSKYYTPTTVSIGPYHHDGPNLRPMEKHKEHALLHFLKRAEGKTSLVGLLKKLREELPSIVGAYESLQDDRRWKEKDGEELLLKMMALDGCFLLEVMMFENPSRQSSTPVHLRYATDDPVFSRHGVIYTFPFIMRDMLMLENQIPLLVLRILLDLLPDERQPSIQPDDQQQQQQPSIQPDDQQQQQQPSIQPDDQQQSPLNQFIQCATFAHFPSFTGSLARMNDQQPQVGLQAKEQEESGESQRYQRVHKLIRDFFFVPSEKLVIAGDVDLHILEVYRKIMVGFRSLSRTKTKDKGSQRRNIRKRNVMDNNKEIVRSATELDEAGIRLQRSKSGDLRSIKFSGHTLEIPPMTIDDMTKPTFLNMMAFERLHVGEDNDVTSFVFFMDSIVDASRDVALLSSKKIVQNALGSDKDVANLFNNMSTELTPDPDGVLYGIHQQVQKYCSSKLHNWRANLVHTYFRSPWALISLVAAIFLVVLTVLQTVYTVYPYYHPAGDGVLANSPPASSFFTPASPPR